MKKAPTIEALFVIFLTSFLLGCATQRRCEKKFPDQTETITIIKDSIVTVEKKIFETRDVLKRDTVTKIDTVTNIKIRYSYLAGDSIFIEAECPEEQIKVRSSETTVIKKGSEKTFVPGWLKFIFVGLVIALILFVIYKILKLLKPSLFGDNS